MNGKRKSRRPLARRQAGEVKQPQLPASVRHVHRARDFGVGYGSSSGYGVDRHYVDGHVDPMFRCV